MSLPYNLIKIKNSLEDGATAAIKKSEQLIEISKINFEISNKEKEIDHIYTELGKKIYRKYDKNKTIDNSNVEKSCKDIKKIEEEIHNLKKNILKLQRKKICSLCGSEVEKGSIYCDNCGFKQN